MTALQSARRASEHESTPDLETRRLRRSLDLKMLTGAGWDPVTKIFEPSPEHPVFGFDVCIVRDCESRRMTTNGLCNACQLRYQRTGADLEEFVVIPRVFATGRAESRLCAVCNTPGHERPVKTSRLCQSCESARRNRGQNTDDYIHGDANYAPAQPRTTYGRCTREGCAEWAYRASSRLCHACHRAWRHSNETDVAAWRHLWPRRPKAAQARRLFLSALPERLELETLLLLQGYHADQNVSLSYGSLQSVIDALARSDANSVLDMESFPLSGKLTNRMFRRMRQAIELLLTDPEDELRQDVWRLSVLGLQEGRHVTVDWTVVSQSWLREAAKSWTRTQLATRSPATLTNRPYGFRALSNALALRSDGGHDPSALGRRDVERFLLYLASQASAGDLSESRRQDYIGLAQRLIREGREIGLADAGGPLHGLPTTFAVIQSDRPRAPIRDLEDEDASKALPMTVLAQLLEPVALDVLARVAGEELRAAIELQIYSGRRTYEIPSLRCDCLQWDETLDDNGQVARFPVLVYKPRKRPKTLFRLPLEDAAVPIILAQQRRAQTRFPRTDPRKLALFPREVETIDGTAAISPGRLATAVRRWMAALPSLTGPDGREFDRRNVFPYAFRHTYAQRYADAEVRVEDLQSLMDHDKISTTQGYFRIGQERRRRGVELAMRNQIDRDGHRVRSVAEKLVESEITRRLIGQTAVPYGACTEPSNVKASGRACPLRFRCFGCKHFRTDPTHIGDLKAYLAELLDARERLAVAVPELADWARADAMPQDDEIAAVRRLLRRCQEILDELEPDDRSALTEAIEMGRNVRRRIDGRLPTSARLSVIQVQPDVDPQVAA